jgi:ribonuclease-3
MSEEPQVIDKANVEKLVGTKIRDVSLYQRAFTHKSALKKYKNLTVSYETLEFIGDSVLGFIITRFLFDRYEDQQEGFLTKARTKMVRGKTLCEISEKLNLQTWIIMDDKGMRNGWNTNASILEDVFEALVGAVYLDLGMVHAKKFVFSAYELVEVSLSDDNYKDQLMRQCQAAHDPLPEYIVRGQYPDGTFHIEVYVKGIPSGSGFAMTKKQAEQNAAEMALKKT